MALNMEKELWNGMMEDNMLETFLKVTCMAMENLKKIKVFMKGNLIKTAKFKVLWRLNMDNT
jgi:hypothetical protein